MELVTFLSSALLTHSVVSCRKTESVFNKRHDIPAQMYSRSNSTKSPASVAGNVSEPVLICFGRLREVFALRSVFLYIQSRGCASTGLLRE